MLLSSVFCLLSSVCCFSVPSFSLFLSFSLSLTHTTTVCILFLLPSSFFSRYINCSCSPSCYSKIITVGGTKKIVIYAKRDIEAGEELSYDYLFAIEEDEANKLKCYCGTRMCRGYMN